MAIEAAIEELADTSSGVLAVKEDDGNGKKR